MTPNRITWLTVGAVIIALALQVSVLTEMSWNGVVPNLVLLVVACGALLRGPEFGMAAGLGAGLLLDLAPPADNAAGRWALALVLAGYLAGVIAQRLRPGPGLSFATLVAASFVGTSVFAITGLILGDPVSSVTEALTVVAMSVLLDAFAAALLLPAVRALTERAAVRTVAWA